MAGKAGTGGVVFEFADEWWKNYDNPIRPGSWWNRVAAPDDEKTHDQDPEEYYGLMTAYRQPKPAYQAVKNFYSDPPHLNVQRISAIVSAALILVAVACWVWARHVMRLRNRPQEKPVPLA